MTPVQPGPIGTLLDPLGPQEAGRYRDSVVEVASETLIHRPFGTTRTVVRTEHFRLHRNARRVWLSHWLQPGQLDNDLAGLLAHELFEPGWLAGNEVFESLLTGLVRSTVHDPLLAWHTFYRNTLGRLRRELTRPNENGRHSSIREMAPVYSRALRLVPPGRVLDLGSCFGFFALLLAERSLNTVLASDIAPGAMRLLDLIARGWKVPLDTLVCDAARVPLPDRAVDTVTLIHLLEHLEPPQCAMVLA